jgi:hypothetical protein
MQTLDILNSLSDVLPFKLFFIVLEDMLWFEGEDEVSPLNHVLSCGVHLHQLHDG